MTIPESYRSGTSRFPYVAVPHEDADPSSGTLQLPVILRAMMLGTFGLTIGFGRCL